MSLTQAYENGIHVSELIKDYKKHIRGIRSSCKAEEGVVPLGPRLSELHLSEIRSIGHKLSSIPKPDNSLEWMAYRLGMRIIG
jgi:hypothetical protein